MGTMRNFHSAMKYLSDDLQGSICGSSFLKMVEQKGSVPNQWESSFYTEVGQQGDSAKLHKEGLLTQI